MIIAVLSLLFSVVAWSFERRDRRREMREERHARNVQFELEKRRFDVDMADREALRQAEITAARNGFRTEGEMRVYGFLVRNLGPSWAKHIKVWLTDQREDPISAEELIGPLEVGSEHPVELHVPLLRRSELERLVLWFGWYDASGGPYTEPSNIEVPR